MTWFQRFFYAYNSWQGSVLVTSAGQLYYGKDSLA